MDAPNAPNPANPNAQDQIVDAAQGPANQAQGPAVQNQAQGPAVQNQAQGPANNNAQVGQNVPMQPLQQPAPAQLVPAGPVVPAPQVFYQNWIGKKPEFSGKPEEDAESHLLSTRDWMEAHNFPDEVKVRHFCLTLTGEARLWYESLAPLDNDWPALQNKFRWQYSKIGNTPEQLFHAWRTFKFDENTDTIDSYVLRMSQVAAMLNYGEMQILENFKNTLPYRLYSTLINVNNLRDAIDLAKRVLMKEKLDRQLTGQSSTPFMRMTNNENHAIPNNNKRGVTFDAMETLERKSDCIDKLTSLVSDMKMTMDRKQSSYKPRIYQGRSRNQNRNQQNFTPRKRSFSRGRNQRGNRGNYNYRNNYRPNYRNRSRGRWNNHRSGDRSSNYQTNNRRGNNRPNYRQNAQQTFRNRSQSRNRAENYNNDYTRGRSRERHNDRPVQSRQNTLSHGRNESRSRSNSRVSTNRDRVRCYRCREYDHFASECPNTPTDEEPDYDDADPASLQMMTQDYYPIDSEGEIEYLNL